MSSSFTWLDYSEHDRRAMHDVIHLFRERDTRDELGVGTVRDALSDLLFPGTSTIQTRARYFLLIPWCYQYLQRWARHRSPSLARVEERSREIEIQLRGSLVKSGETSGVIGLEAGAALKRLPSSVYWAGLQAWGIRLFPGSIRQLHSTLRLPTAPRVATEGDDVEPDRDLFWHAGLPPLPKNFADGQTLELSLEEAEYLQERVQCRAPGSLLNWLLDNPSTDAEISVPWAYPHLAQLPARLHTQLEHARCFAVMMHGAALLYNLMLAQKRDWAEKVDTYTALFNQWAAEIEGDRAAFGSWSRERLAFWDIILTINPSVPVTTRRFIDSWIDLVLNKIDGPQALAAESAARDLISDREWRLKRNRARLHDRRALELWSGSAGAGLINYRWTVVSTLVGDIRRGLENQEANRA